MNRKTIHDCSIMTIQQLGGRQGHLAVISNNLDLPFNIERVFYLYDIPGGESRGAHAHKECHQFLIAASGAFEVNVDDGKNSKSFNLNRPDFGLYIPPGIWAAEKNFSSGSICLVLASHMYSEVDYIRSYDSFLEYIS